MNPISNKLSWKYQKNKHLIDSLILKNAPEFIYRHDPSELEGEIPVFTFHIAVPEWFEEQCLHLINNGYRTLSSEEFLEHLTRPGQSIKKAVLISFDDGLKHVWTVAYPILKKYGMKATCFLIPGCIPDDDLRIRPTLEQYWKGEVPLTEIMSLAKGDALATWSEIKIMHESGVIDFQSHTMFHSLVNVSPRIYDFVHPNYDSNFYGNVNIPLYTRQGVEYTTRSAVLGAPIYYAKPRMCALRRFYDDEKIRGLCAESVEKWGAEDYFNQKGWRRRLRRLVNDYRSRYQVKERYETIEERDEDVFNELLKSKQIIEEKLPGREVKHLCYPWFEAEKFAIEISRKAGYKANYFGIAKKRSTNRNGDDPFKVVRVEDIFLQRLPGAGRQKVRDIFMRLYSMKNLPLLLKGEVDRVDGEIDTSIGRGVKKSN